ncbi:sulfatase-like hydrolase/transferase [Aestuariivivens sediminicola]|uniref:sulfatase-like hydrolase/transferase n=1 Tax=Aestuariivivens sediminicola TaxID=2913560 RepID=UPI0024129AD5|nr:sulfatase-like hydrolase/transferase [Aestuariivivens sediminicola]
MTSCSQRESPEARPNIIFIMADDLGYGDLSSYGRTEYTTPHIDGLIKGGIKFNQAYAAAPVCTPTRVALMTGKYPARNEIGLKEPLDEFEDKHLGLSSHIPTLSSMMKAAGYRTALFGKWDLGSIPEALPNAHGFDYFYGITGGAADYIDHQSINGLHQLYENNRPIEDDGYLTDRIADHTIAYIEKNLDKPFFISLQFNAPHWPWQQPGDGPHPFDSTWQGFQEGGSPDIFANMMRNLDWNVGRILKTLDTHGLSHNTIVIFTSDNGGETYSDMGTLRGQKLSLYEGGIKIPAGLRWPGVVDEGRVSEQPIITMDWTATILRIGQANIPKGLRLDGMDLTDHLKGNKEIKPREFYWRYGLLNTEGEENAYRKGDWKYLSNSEGKFLFNLKEDPSEKQDLKHLKKNKFDQLKTAFQALDKKMLGRVTVNEKTTTRN